jgi:outer membrane receptor protein involved in Fe transport
VSNVTLNATTAQKQNLGKTRIWGVQSDVEYRLSQSLRLSGGYLYNQAKVTDGGLANAALVGKYLPQVPKHRGSLQVAYSNPKYASVALSLQFMGSQFNDDQNINFIPVPTLTAAGYAADTPVGLPGYTSVDLTLARDLGRNFQVFFGVQNLTDTVYFVQTNPSTIGTPRLVNGGFRIRFSGR